MKTTKTFVDSFGQPFCKDIEEAIPHKEILVCLLRVRY